jgi:hypothetical protein
LRRLQFFPGSVKLRESTGRAGGLPKGNYNALQLADLMNRQIESSGRLFGEIKNFYMLENKIAKSKG